MKKHLRDIVVINFVIALVIAVVTGDPGNWSYAFAAAFVFSQAIGITIYVLVHFLWPLLERFSKFTRSIGLIVLFLAGGIVGAQTGAWLFLWTLNIEIPIWRPSTLYPTLGLAVIFGALGYLYFDLTEKAEESAKALKEKELQEERLKGLATKAELNALQSRINPHFLFNTLNSIASLISDDPKKAESTVQKLAEVFRSTLLSSEKGRVKLTEELKIVRDYLDIEQIRLGDRLRFTIICDPALAEEVDIPALTLQPLVENSIRHGIMHNIEGGSVSVAARQEGSQCVIEVTDDGAGFVDSASAKGHGLSSVRERLALTYGERAHFSINGTQGTRVVISLPIHQD